MIPREQKWGTRLREGRNLLMAVKDYKWSVLLELKRNFIKSFLQLSTLQMEEELIYSLSPSSLIQGRPWYLFVFWFANKEKLSGSPWGLIPWGGNLGISRGLGWWVQVKAIFTPVKSCTTAMVCIGGGAERFGRGTRVIPSQNLNSKIYDRLPNHYILITLLNAWHTISTQ